MWGRENLIRCVAYYGDVADNPPPGEVERIADRARRRNAELGITGCLFYFGRHFVQVLEGPPAEVDRLYGTLAADSQHPDVVALLDTLVQARSYSGWSLKFVGDGSAGAAQRGEALPASRPARRFNLAANDAGAGEAATAILQRAPADLALQAARHLRVAPQQQRAWQTVERLLDAVSRMLVSSATFEGLSLEAAAANAGVTPQSAYRYFANIDDLVRAGVRRTQAHWNARFLDFMLRQTFESEAEIAEATVAFIAETYETQLGATGKLKRVILSNYHDVDYDAARTLSNAIVAAVGGARGPALRARAAEMAAGLVALWAVAKGLALRDAALLGRPAVQYMMAAIFLAALRGPLPIDARDFAELV